MSANKNKVETMKKHISCDCKCAACNSDKKWNSKTCQCECKNYRTQIKDYSSNPSTCNRENNKYLKSIADTSVIACDEIMSVMDIVSRKKKNIKQQMCQ